MRRAGPSVSRIQAAKWIGGAARQAARVSLGGLVCLRFGFATHTPFITRRVSRA